MTIDNRKEENAMSVSWGSNRKSHPFPVTNLVCIVAIVALFVLLYLMPAIPASR